MGHRRESDEQKQAFAEWYAKGRNVAVVGSNMAVPERTLFRWIKMFRWHERADELDAEAAHIARQEAIQRKAQLLQSQANVGRNMWVIGAAKLKDLSASKEPLTVSEIVKLIEKGIAIERQAEGLPSEILELMNASPDDLLREYARIASRIRASAVDREDTGE
jgi:hypothetical protein